MTALYAGGRVTLEPDIYGHKLTANIYTSDSNPSCLWSIKNYRTKLVASLSKVKNSSVYRHNGGQLCALLKSSIQYCCDGPRELKGAINHPHDAKRH